MKITSHRKILAIIVLMCVIPLMFFVGQESKAQGSNQQRSGRTPSPVRNQGSEDASNPSPTQQSIPVQYMEDNSWHAAVVISVLLILFGFLVIGTYFVIRYRRRARKLLGHKSSGLARPFGGRESSYLD